MADNFLAGDRDQAFLLPPDLRDWLPADHLAWFVLDVVDQLPGPCRQHHASILVPPNATSPRRTSATSS
jgi:hypothetical protein